MHINISFAIIRVISLELAVVLFLSGTTLAAPVFIVADYGDYPTAEKAGQDEVNVNWLDGDTSDDTICTQCFAACELQHYLRKLTGRTDDFTIVNDNHCPNDGELILIGGPESNAMSWKMKNALGVDIQQLARLGRDGYRIKTARVDRRRVTLVAGGSRRGTLYAAYDLLHRLGCRWFAPGKNHEHVPKVRWKPNFDVSEQPSFDTRGFYIFEKRGDDDFWLWMARNRLNEWSVLTENPSQLHKLGFLLSCGNHAAESMFIGPKLAYPYNHAKFDGDQHNPADPYPLSAEYRGDENNDGELSYFEAHPEWYAKVAGERVPGIGGKGGKFGTNYCTSNIHATDEFMKNYVDALVEGGYRGSTIVNFWTLDVGKWCQCEKCKKLGMPTDRNILLVHRLDQEIKKAQAGKRLLSPVQIRFLAYSDVIDPPTRPLPNSFDYKTCIVTFYPIMRSYVFNFNSPASSANAEYCRQLEAWMTKPKRHYQGQLVIGEYYNVSRYRCLPLVFMHTMANDIPYYHSVGARYFQYMHVTTGNWGNKALTNYQMARQLWDSTIDCEALWEDYFARRYGTLATKMRVFYETLEKMLANVHKLKYELAPRLNCGANRLFPTAELRYRREAGVDCIGPTFLDMVENGKICRQLIDQAMAATDVPRKVMVRLLEDERMFTYGERTLGYYAACIDAHRHAKAGLLEQARDDLTEAKRLAKLLRADTISLTMTSEHASATNSLEASGAAEALEHLEALMAK